MAGQNCMQGRWLWVGWKLMKRLVRVRMNLAAWKVGFHKNWPRRRYSERRIVRRKGPTTAAWMTAWMTARTTELTLTGRKMGPTTGVLTEGFVDDSAVRVE